MKGHKVYKRFDVGDIFYTDDGGYVAEEEELSWDDSEGDVQKEEKKTQEKAEPKAPPPFPITFITGN